MFLLGNQAVDKAFHSTNALQLSARPHDVDGSTSGRWKLGNFPRVQGPSSLSRSPVDAPRPPSITPVGTRKPEYQLSLLDFGEKFISSIFHSRQPNGEGSTLRAFKATRLELPHAHMICPVSSNKHSNGQTSRPKAFPPRRGAGSSMTPLAARLAAPAALLLLVLLLPAPASATNFTCATVGKTCQSAMGYAVPNATTYGELATRFNTTTTLAELLGANGLPASTPASTPLAAKTTVSVPFQCRCGSNGVGQSDGGPIYVVYPLDGLDHIARDVFDAFVTYQEIATANNISDVNHIEVGQKLRIPLPCTCDQVDGADVIHFAYSVAKGDDPPGIAAKFGVTESTLLSVNKITDPKSLKEGQILDVPIPVCQSSSSNTSADYNLLVLNGTACQKGGAARSEFARSTWRTSIIAFLMALILICFL